MQEKYREFGRTEGYQEVLSNDSQPHRDDRTLLACFYCSVHTRLRSQGV